MRADETADADLSNPAAERPLASVLELEKVETDLYRTTHESPEPYSMFGGQLLAQGLKAAGLTVPDDRAPNSLHAYFVRAGDTAHPVTYCVIRDHDGRSFSARRVVALQHDRVICTLAASFQTAVGGPDVQLPTMPSVTDPDSSPEFRVPRNYAFEGRWVEQEHPHEELPTRFWARAIASDRQDILSGACGIAYVSDFSCGVAPLNTDTHRSDGSLDHALWFHRPHPPDAWALFDMVPQSVAVGRGWYVGAVFAADGTLVASFSQQSLFRAGSGLYFGHEPAPMIDQ